MKPSNMAWLAMSVLALTSYAQNAPPSYSQSYAILVKGVRAGSETVTETTNKAGDLVSESEHEILITDGLETKRMTFSTKMILAKSTFAPISYTYRYTSGEAKDSYEVEIKDARIIRILNRGGHTSQVNIAAQPNTIILDFNVYHQYDHVVSRYDGKKGGRQLFADFIPLIGSDIPVALTFLGRTTMDFEKGSIPVRNFKVEFVNIWSGSLFVDEDGRLVRLVIPSQDLEVVRKDLLSSADADH
jgi:hypothetical protein